MQVTSSIWLDFPVYLLTFRLPHHFQLDIFTMTECSLETSHSPCLTTALDYFVKIVKQLQRCHFAKLTPLRNPRQTDRTPALGIWPSHPDPRLDNLRPPHKDESAIVLPKTWGEPVDIDFSPCKAGTMLEYWIWQKMRSCKLSVCVPNQAALCTSSMQNVQAASATSITNRSCYHAIFLIATPVEWLQKPPLHPYR